MLGVLNLPIEVPVIVEDTRVEQFELRLLTIRKATDGKTVPLQLALRNRLAAAFDFAGVNGRSLTDDVMDVILSLATNTALGDGVPPDKGRTQPAFPYFGTPYAKAEQMMFIQARDA